MEADPEEAGRVQAPTKGPHITKRALKNKSLAVSFNEKDLKLVDKTPPLFSVGSVFMFNFELFLRILVTWVLSFSIRDYVTGFHKRKKKRRKEANKQQEAALRRKRIEQRKKVQSF